MRACAFPRRHVPTLNAAASMEGVSLSIAPPIPDPSRRRVASRLLGLGGEIRVVGVALWERKAVDALGEAYDEVVRRDVRRLDIDHRLADGGGDLFPHGLIAARCGGARSTWASSPPRTRAER